MKITTALTNVVALTLISSPALAQFGGGSAGPAIQLPVVDERGDEEQQDPKTERSMQSLPKRADTSVSGTDRDWKMAQERLLHHGYHKGRGTHGLLPVRPDFTPKSNRPVTELSGKRNLRPMDRAGVDAFSSKQGNWVLVDASVLGKNPAGSDVRPPVSHASSALVESSGAAKSQGGGGVPLADAGVLSGGVSHAGGAQAIVEKLARSYQIDVGPALTNAEVYGNGLAGTIGMPHLSYLGDLAPGSTIKLFAENSAGVETFGYLRAGYQEISYDLRAGGTLLCDTSIMLKAIHLAPGTQAIDFTIPADALTFGSAICAQVLVADEGAAGGFALTKGLKLFL